MLECQGQWHQQQQTLWLICQGNSKQANEGVVAVPELVGIEGKTQEKANIEVAASVKMMTRSSQICLSYLSRVQKTSAMMLRNMNHLGMLLI